MYCALSIKYCLLFQSESEVLDFGHCYMKIYAGAPELDKCIGPALKKSFYF